MLISQQVIPFTEYAGSESASSLQFGFGQKLDGTTRRSGKSLSSPCPVPALQTKGPRVIWSISESKTFRRCQRQWFFKNIIANGVTKDQARRRIYLLSKLQSLSSWRGQIVDTVISDLIMPAVASKRRITLKQAKSKSSSIFKQQLACARKHPIWSEGFTPSKLGDDFAAFHCMEYQGYIDENELEQAAKEIDLALTNLFAMDAIKQILKSATALIAQRPLIFSHSGVSVRAVPDLIAFFDNRPPMIVDWKVHVFGIQEAWLQLAVYALALTNCKRHKDFPLALGGVKPTDIELAEVQLLKNRVRQYSLSTDEIEAAEAYIAESCTEMLMAVDGRPHHQLSPDDFSVTNYPNACVSCAFRKCCWEDMEVAP